MAFGLFSVTAMLVCYPLEDRGHWFVLAFAAACAMGSVYGFLQGAWPFGLGYSRLYCGDAGGAVLTDDIAALRARLVEMRADLIAMLVKEMGAGELVLLGNVGAALAALDATNPATTLPQPR